MFDDLAKELRDGLICPVLIGSATRTNGVLRLTKALRHEAPGVADTVKRLGVAPTGDAVACVLKTLHTAHGGKMSIARVLAGQAGDNTTFITPEKDAGRISARSSCSAPIARSAAPPLRRRRSPSASSIMPRPATR